MKSPHTLTVVLILVIVSGLAFVSYHIIGSAKRAHEVREQERLERLIEYRNQLRHQCQLSFPRGECE